MADATVTYEEETEPGKKYALLEASDGETYNPGLSKINGVVATNNDSAGTALTASFSGTTVTINGTSLADAKVSIIAWGQL